ncbi:hypothetical protein ACFSMW_16050 [Virgibacillus halophilus]|uniref:Uncharacterized protein n=1 Tax=Tigheibacillus halophilus TaxID=361280 RepID=A0ABU5C3T7_9BACI|nr:hypothetical protein [Virgibacillus halophilus]
MNKGAAKELGLMSSMVFSTVVHAEERAGNDFLVNPMANDMTGYEYVHKSTSKSKKTEFIHDASNPSSTTDSVSYSVSVTQSSSANVTASATFKTMVAKAGVSTQVGLGTSKTKKVTMTWSIPKKSKYRLRAGSQWVKESGTEKYWKAGKLVSSKTVAGNWTFASWSDKVKQ